MRIQIIQSYELAIGYAQKFRQVVKSFRSADTVISVSGYDSTQYRICALSKVLAVIACMLLATSIVNTTYAATSTVCTPSQLSAAIADAKPGDSIEMCDQTWRDLTIDFKVNGASNAPITLKARTPGGVVLTGAARIELSGKFAVIDGLIFSGPDTGNSVGVIQFRNGSGPCTDCRITNISIVDYNPMSQDQLSQWVVMYGNRNRVDHSHFSGKNNLGSMLRVHRGADQSKSMHQIDHNLFENRPEITGQGNVNGDTVEIGSTGKFSAGFAETTVEFNYFLNIDSDFEVLTIKSSGNRIRYNVLDSSRGVLSLRHGSNNVVHGNYILGRGKDGTGGIRISGKNHIVTSNYISDINPSTKMALAAIGLNGGTDEIVVTSGEGATDYIKFERADNVTVAHNTIISSGSSIVIGNGRQLNPQNIEILNNIVLSGKGLAIEDAGIGANVTLGANIVFDSTIGSITAGVIQVNPDLSLDSRGIRRPGQESSVIAAAMNIGMPVTDMDGQQRSSPADIGADEFVSIEVARGPISLCEVGPVNFRTNAGDSCGDKPITKTIPIPPQFMSAED